MPLFKPAAGLAPSCCAVRVQSAHCAFACAVIQSSKPQQMMVNIPFFINTKLVKPTLIIEAS
jgi:hypothetical protein